MASPVLQTCDMVGNILKGSDLGLSAGTFLATASPKNLTAIQTPVPETMVLLVRLSSGNITAAVDVNDTGTYSSADSTVTISATGEFRALAFSTSSTDSYAAIRLTTSANGIIDRFGVLSLSKLTAGEEFRSVRAGRNAVACAEMTSGSDGSGAWLSDLDVSA